MSVHIVIDGYNLIRQSPTLSAIEHRSLEEGREALLQRLVSYKKVRHHPVTVVFDGADADHSPDARSQWKGIRVLFSRPGELADSVIKRIVTQERERAVVVTSDRDITDFAAELGAATMDSVAFENKMNTAAHTEMNHTDFFEEEGEGWKPTTKKKGPSRRLTKRQRKSRIKTKKL
ncbi:MAG: NYN domain-containing protein [Desulfobacterales bacterium]|nr:MAG: NYN domain-containing protein [Desulfobacterales bacterium]